MKLLLQSIALTACLFFLSSCGEKKPKVPPLEELIKQELTEHVQDVTKEMMSSLEVPMEIQGPEYEIESNETAGVAMAKLTWKYIVKEQQYYPLPHEILETENATYEVIAPDLGPGSVASECSDIAMFSVTDGIPILDGQIKQGDMVRLLESPLGASGVRSDFSEEAVIVDSSEYIKLKEEAEVYAQKKAEEERVAAEKQAELDKIAAGKRAQEVRIVKQNLMTSISKGGSYNGLLTPTRKGKEYEPYKLEISEFTISEIAGKKRVSLTLAQYYNAITGKTIAKKAVFEGGFNDSGYVETIAVKNSSKGPNSITSLIKYSGGKILVKPSEHKDRIIVSATRKDFNYNGEFVREQ